MQIKVNGEVLTLNEETFLNVLLQKQQETVTGSAGEVLGNVIVEYNGEIIPHENWNQIQLKEGDSLEIFKFVGGGR